MKRIYALLIAVIITGNLFAQSPTLLKDINSTTSSSSPNGFTQVGNIAFFTADDGVHGRELWKTDGTTAGTKMVKDIWAGGGGSAPFNLTGMNGTVFFTAQASSDIYKLFKSDGTGAGTVMIGDTESSNTFDGPDNLTNVNGTLFFKAHNNISGTNLWKTDGTNAGTVMVTNNTPGLSDYMSYFTNVDGTLFFIDGNGAIGSSHSALWKSDGTAEGTVLVKNIRPESPTNNINSLISFNGKLFFVTDDGVYRPELWTSDGTEEGTLLFKDLVPGTEGSYPENLKVIGNSLYFSISNGNIPISGMYKTDGTPDGTIAIANGSGGSYFTNQEQFTAIDSTVFFRANGLQIWKVGITDTAAVMVKNIPYTASVPDPRPKFMTAANGVLFFSAASNAAGEELWKSDGTEAGTVAIDILPGAAGSTPQYLTPVNNSLVFAATDPTHGTELWIVKMGSCVWTGNINTAWEAPGNWSTNMVPTASSAVIIPAGRLNYPVVSVSTTVKSISCEQGSSLSVLPGVDLKLLK